MAEAEHRASAVKVDVPVEAIQIIDPQVVSSKPTFYHLAPSCLLRTVPKVTGLKIRTFLTAHRISTWNGDRIDYSPWRQCLDPHRYVERYLRRRAGEILLKGLSRRQGERIPC